MGACQNFSVAQGEILITMSIIHNFKNNSGDKQIIDVVIHENELIKAQVRVRCLYY